MSKVRGKKASAKPAANQHLNKLADRVTIEDQLMRLQYECGHECKINHTVKSDMHVWIRTITEQIANVPELRSRQDNVKGKYFLKSITL